MDSRSDRTRVKVDRHGRLVLPLWIRRELLIAAPGEVGLRRTADGVLLTPAAAESGVEEGATACPR